MMCIKSSVVAAKGLNVIDLSAVYNLWPFGTSINDRVYLSFLAAPGGLLLSLIFTAIKISFLTNIDILEISGDFHG